MDAHAYLAELAKFRLIPTDLDKELIDGFIHLYLQAGEFIFIYNNFAFVIIIFW